MRNASNFPFREGHPQTVRAVAGLRKAFACGSTDRARRVEYYVQIRFFVTEPIISLLSDQTLFRQGICELLRRHGYHRVGEFSSSQALRAAAAAQRPDIVVADLDHEHEDTTVLVRTLRAELPHTHLIVIGSAVRQAAASTISTERLETPSATKIDLEAAARGRRRQQSVNLIRELRKWHRVTPRQRDVMRWLALGLDNNAIAHKLRVGERAIKLHITNLLDEFQLANRTQLALLAYQAGLRPPSGRTTWM